jgi:nitroreductase
LPKTNYYQQEVIRGVVVMDVEEAIGKRRAYRALEPVHIDEALIKDLACSAQLAPSCFNNQPWRFAFVHTPDVLEKLQMALTRGNKWAFAASMIIIVYSHPKDDCQIRGRDFYLFDTGIATAFLILRATELGLVAHPIAGFDETEVMKLLEISKEATIITLVIIGKHADKMTNLMSDQQIEAEKTRPLRKTLDDFIIIK